LKVKYNNNTIDVPNQSETPRKDFCSDWNDYAIEILKENNEQWYIQLTNPHGEYDYDGYFKGTMKEALQDCFDNIDYPPMTIDEEGEF